MSKVIDQTVSGHDDGPDSCPSTTLPPACELPLLERFLKAEAMAMWAVQSAQRLALPPHVLNFLRRHEADELKHLRQFESLLGRSPRERSSLPAVPQQWSALAVHLFGYEVLGYEFARLLIGLRPDLADILDDEAVHVGFFERQLRDLVARGGTSAQATRAAAQAWWRRIPRTVDRYLGDRALAPYYAELRSRILAAIEDRLKALTLLQ